MDNRTGIANGTLRPCIYFSRIPDMHAVLAPMDKDHGIDLARMVFERGRDQHGRPFKTHWIWCEATTLHEIDRLQKRLTNQEIFESNKRIELNSFRRDQIYKQTGDALRGQMCSAASSQWERDFIRQYLALRENKRDQYRDALSHHNHYIFSREQSESKNVEDLLPLLPGQYERAGV